jgi:hypothetical protein
VPDNYKGCNQSQLSLLLAFFSVIFENMTSIVKTFYDNPTISITTGAALPEKKKCKTLKSQP